MAQLALGEEVLDRERVREQVEPSQAHPGLPNGLGQFVTVPELGLEIGAKHAIDPGEAPLAEQVADMTDGRSFDVVIEAAGVPAAMASAFSVAALHARVVFVGIDVGGSAPVEIGLIQSKALHVRGIIGSAGLWPRTIRFMATSGVDPTPLLTATFPLAESTAALDAARDTTRNVKVQIEC